MADLKGARRSLNYQNAGETVVIVADYLDALVIAHKTACRP